MLSIIDFLQEGSFKIQTFEQAASLADFLSSHCSNSNIVRMGLLELFTNGIEHGNLKIGSEEKNRLQKEGRWMDEVTRRLSLSENKNKMVTIEVIRKENEMQIKVSDEGDGFEWKKFHHDNKECSKEAHGRGILMAKELAFKKLEYNEKGNVVTAIVLIK